ncbi:alpha/beta fold hydrolase [Pseudomonas gingeri]|uniref:Alpha/beta hydrolase n=1 Tax=Pseudomonas gingeri TaxID=117681 RepID=A0A7Y7YA78_9PSED|nr:alpha/beta hydrolase [Pseudomonas gingeri]NWB26748.1 alpha/beta hydrolase [Pseudomonas gingeri]NWC32702.1 alpha/beta hydrolase [Pseudomonas gingeri]NWD52739.1 alpha/beta hydrolase [Pseudomonas gingeri]
MTNPFVKRTYVLIAGAWHGGWVWRDIIPALRALGHEVSAPTLSGLGERRDGAHDDIDLSTHIDDVIAHLDMEGLQEVTLVGWSYGGMVISGVAERLPERITGMIYLDAMVPEDGKALVDYLPIESREALIELTRDGSSIPPMPLERFGVHQPELIEFLTPRLTAQPWRTFFEPVRCGPLAEHIAVGYIRCSGYDAPHFQETYARMQLRPGVSTAQIATGHMCMLSEPQRTTELLANLL